ncbi:hypothetical protein GIB67_029676 [Kingdonia uniflora]|uniref:Peptidase C19 ubiquitin carboxyl-terminal hydrolase domain-containing protein n=1 Tax=Kingdonia uniflora TaxID=39325 RepID=A0A7J7LLI0_9MAGN|nr:hypothetical protein GIB67_029676 [Kingdonia uniflora]
MFKISHRKITTDSNKVLVFGSFTEDDDVISLKKKSPEKIREPLEKKGLQFGSLDFASVKSLGSPDIKLKHSKLSDLPKSAAPPKFVNEDNGFSSSKTTEDNGYTHSPPHVFPLNNDPDTLDDATLEHQSNLVIYVPNEVHVDSSEPLASKEDKQIALNGPRAAATDLLPRAVTGLKARTIPKIGYPTLSAFLQFISEFDMPTGSSLIKNQRVVIETGRSPFCLSIFEQTLKKFTPDVTNGISSKPRQEDTQEFLSFVMDQMHDELLQLEGPKNKTAITRTQSFVPSELSAIFGGQLRSNVKARGSKASARISHNPAVPFAPP